MSKPISCLPGRRASLAPASPSTALVFVSLVLLLPAIRILPCHAASRSIADKTGPLWSSGTAIPGLDSLASATLRRALDYLEIEPNELGFDKLYADDDTFRLNTVEEILADPLKLPGYQEETLERIRGAVARPRELPLLAGILGELSEAPASTEGGKGIGTPRPRATPVLGANSAPPAPDLQRISDAFVGNCAGSALFLEKAFAGLTPEDRRRVLLLAPAFWGDSEDPVDKVRKGALHRELGAPTDTTLKLSEDPILDAAVKLDRGALTEATRLFWNAVVVLQADLQATPIPWAPRTNAPSVLLDGVTGLITAAFETPWGLLVFGGSEANTYSEEALRRIAFLVEPDGNDVYRGRAASSVGELLRPLSAVIDLAGNDLYECRDRAFSVGGAVLGLSALIDLAGDDIYRADDGSLGAGFFGSGVLFDGRGCDIFEGRNLCQGSGAFGIGALISQADPVPPPGPEIQEDRGYRLGLIRVPGTGAVPVRYDDNDTYLCARQSQGFASTYGIGLLYDKTGNDIYRSGGRYLHKPLLPHDFQSLSQGFSIGFRPRAGGGIGILCDEEGNDFYDAEVYAQGASYWYSIGLQFDGAGNDRYLATQYAQGAGIHLSVGSLWDRGGDDHYVCKFGVTQGTAHDLSVGMLLEEGGNDFYIVSDGQGMSITNSTAIFIDGQGNDVYATPGVGQGALTWARGFCGPAIFLDLEGKDTYPRDAPSKNGAVWSSGLYAVGIDLDRDVRLPDEVIPEPILTSADSARTVEELFDTASLWEVGSARETVKRARMALLTKPHEAMLFAVGKRLDSQDGLVYRTLLEVAKAQADSFTTRVLPRLRDPDQYVQRNVIALLGEMKRKDARLPIEAMLKDPKQEKHWTRLVQALGNIGDPAASAAVRPFLLDGKERRRIQAAVALASLKDTLSVPALVGLLEDPYLTVRSAASNALVSFRAAVVEPLAASLQANPTTRAVPAAMSAPKRAVHLRTLGQIAAAIPDSAGEADLLSRARGRRALMSALQAYAEVGLQSERAAAVEGLMKFKDEETAAFVRLCLHDEADPLVLRTYEKALEAAKKK